MISMVLLTGCVGEADFVTNLSKCEAYYDVTLSFNEDTADLTLIGDNVRIVLHKISNKEIKSLNLEGHYDVYNEDGIHFKFIEIDSFLGTPIKK